MLDVSHGRPSAAVAPRRESAMRDIVSQAARELTTGGWTIVERTTNEAAPWHLIAERGARRRVVQIAPPETPPALRQARRLELGEAVRLPTQGGTMEQWLAHVRPDGRVSFGPYVLNGQRWGV